MRIIYDDLRKKIDIKSKNPAVITIGVFDGIHLGHRLILEKLKFYSKKENLNSVVFTFDIPPKLFLKKIDGYITDVYDKIIFLKKLDIDCIWIFKVKNSLLNLSKEDFISHIMRYFSIKIFIIGDDFKFGYKREGDIDYLSKLAKENNFRLVVIKKKIKDKKIISSSLIRSFIVNGRVDEVVKFLGRNYFIKGKVYKNKGIGKKLGFPTANISAYNYVIPKKGVYAGIVEVEKNRYLGAINIGNKPTINFSSEISIEVHIINFKKNIVDKEIKIFFLERLRDEKKFIDIIELKKAIKKDIEYITDKYKKYTQIIPTKYSISLSI